MKIAIDCADLDCRRIDGTRVYIKNVLNFLGRITSQNRYFLYHQQDFNPLLIPYQCPNYIERKIPYPIWWTQTRLAYELLQDQPDVLWMPIQQIPFLIRKKIKTVVTIHDLAFKIFPENFTRVDRFKLNLFTDVAIKRAEKIIAVSHTTKKDILKFYPQIKEEKIKVIYHGYDTKFSQSSPTAAIAAVLRKYRIAPPYLLYVGAIQPRKDLITLIRAFEEIKKQPVGTKLKLVIVGEAAWKAAETLEKIKESAFREDIIMPGRVSFEDLANIYQGAGVFVFPSLYEGFGMPILEAWASKIPVIVADNSSLREIGGEAVIKFPTGNVGVLMDKIKEVLEKPSIREYLRKAGEEKLKKFSWKTCAKETLSVIKEAGNQE